MPFKSSSRPGIVVILAIACAVFAFGIGILIGYYSRGGSGNANAEKLPASESQQARDKTKKTLIDLVKPDNIRESLKYLSAEPHLAGTARDEELARHIHDRWSSYGFDDVNLHPYQVTLSYPDSSNPNKVELLENSGQVIWQSKHKEDTLRPEDEHPDFIHSFNSYSPAASVKGDLVYVNFGRVEDFDILKEKGIDVKDKICIIRYGKVYRGNKVKHAEERGAVGVILFLDPQEVALNGTEPLNVYPNSWWMPGTAMQRGTILQGNGDPSTPGYPSIDGVYRVPNDKLKVPKIPSQPIGYEDALKLLSLMDGPTGPKEWAGLLPTEYKLGPGFKGQDSSKKVQIRVNNRLKSVKSYNVIGTIQGAVEPDRYVLIGNHRDSWGYGAVDASTGTAQLLELSRIMSELMKQGWKPRRTIVFCSWGAEEYGLIGSYEWVEEKLPKLQDRGVAYINVDICASGDALSIDSSPLLFDFLWDVTKQVPDPKVAGKTVYDVWKARYPNDTQPKIATPGSGSDHAPFTFYAGVPIVNMWWKRNKAKYDISIYPAYHTGYETFFLVDKYIDPGFKIHESCVRLSGLMLLELSQRAMFPFNAVTLAKTMSDSLSSFRTKNKDSLTTDIGLDKLEMKLSEFDEIAKQWHERAEKQENISPLMQRQLNDQLLAIERAFIKPDGLPDSPLKRHMIFAPSKYDSYSGGAFPALADLMYGIGKLEGDEKTERWMKLKMHVSDLVVVIHYATELLKPLHII